VPPPIGYAKLRPSAARVEHFRCFHDSGWVRLDGVTTLVAENEFGKTSFLEALGWFSTTDVIDKDDLREGTEGDVAIVSLRYSLDNHARIELNNNGMAGPDEVVVTKYRSGAFTAVDAATGENVAEGNLFGFRSAYESFRDALVSSLTGWSVVGMPEAEQQARGEAASLRDATVGDGVATSVALQMTAVLAPLGAGTAPADNILRLCERIQEVETNFRAAPRAAFDTLIPFLAQFVYFDENVDLLPDEIRYEHLAMPWQYPAEANLARLMGFDVASVPQQGFGRQQESQRLSRTLSEQFSPFWDAGEGLPIQIELHQESDAIHVVVNHVRSQPPSRRSRGMRWFLGFVTKFTAETNDQLRDSVLLIDEPGLSLHVKQQARFLNLLDELSKANTIVYSTHLPYLIPRNKLSRVRLLVGDDEHPGAVTVRSNIHGVPSDADVLKPIRAALGVGIADSITLGSATLIVEGAADMYLVDAMRTFCAAANLETLPEEVTILPAGGAGEKMMPLAAFLASGQMRGALLVDSDTEGRSTARTARNRFDELVAVEFTHAEDPTLELSIEDLVDRGYYLALANETVAQRPNAAPVEIGELNTAAPICKAVSAAFAASGYGDFQKLKAALRLQARAELREDPPPGETLEAFSALFARLRATVEPDCRSSTS
jgi:hypothetical protein